MFEHKDEHCISRMAKVLEASESGYYKWLARATAPPSPKEQADIELAEQITVIFRRSRGSYGARKITAVLNAGRPANVNHKRVERLMREYGLFSRTCKRYRCTTDSDHNELIADNLLDRDFTADAPNQKMVSDTTVVVTKEGDLYAAGILYLYGRVPVGFSMSRHNDTALVMAAFNDMICRGLGAPGCILHSDRGSTYCSRSYRKLLSRYDFLSSMSGNGDCWDNAPMESFWGKMKSEWLKPKYETIAEAKKDIYEYVWHFYPSERPHATNGYLTPAVYGRR